MIIKTLIASQIGYLAEIKTVPNNVIKLIESLILNFVWNNKQPLVNRKTMHLSTNEGGVKILKLRDFIESKRIHFIYKIIKLEYENWNVIGKQWLKTLDTEYDTEYSLANALASKALIYMVFQSIIKSVLHLGRDVLEY